ncbi:MAG: hypothetical protein CNLJKLNK_00651 [Holosporales bacterium]
MKYINFFLMVFSCGLRAAGPQESLQHINDHLKLALENKTEIENALACPASLFLKTQYFSPLHSIVAMRPNIKFQYKGQWQVETFLVDEDAPIHAYFSIALQPNAIKTIGNLVAIIQIKTQRENFSFEVHQGHHPQCSRRIIIQAAPLYLLKMPDFELNKICQICSSFPPYAQYFCDTFISQTLPFEQYKEKIENAYTRFLSRQKLVPHDIPFFIPLNLFTIWFTARENPKDIKQEEKELIEQTKSVCPEKDGWTHYFCVNDIADFPEICEGKRIIEMSKIFQKQAYSRLNLVYQEALLARNFGKASDIARVVLLYEFGGIYTDTDVAIMQSPKRLHQLCNFYGGLEHMENFSPGNAVIGARARHPILKQYIELMEEGIFCHQPPLDHWIIRTLFETGPYALAKAFILALGERDVLFPPQVFYSSSRPMTEGDVSTLSFPFFCVGRHECGRNWIKNHDG